MTSRKYYDMELQKLNGALLEMGEMIRMAISGAVAALLEHDHDRARSIIAYDEEIDKQNRQIEQQCYSLLLSQQPVAGDLRMVSAALKMTTDMERIGDHAADISEIVTFLDYATVVQPEHFGAMSRAAIDMVHRAIDAYVRQDVELARAVILSDDTVDQLFTDVKRELIELIGAEIDRLSQLVEQLMSPAPQRPHAPLNIHAVLERVLRLAETEGGWAVRMQRDYDPSIPEFSGDADRLTQAVWNLVRNALQASASTIILRTRVESGLHIRDHVHARALRVEIDDDGRGVPDELAEHLFLPLVSGRAEGTGLGLALAHQVAREHRGSLGYRSRPGHTVFTLLLPHNGPEAATTP